MARKFGKKNVIKIDPLAYNIGLIGESGIGKSTIVKEMCEKLVGEDGYLILDLGREDGIDAIANAIYEKVEKWSNFIEITDDIIENRLTDYKDLKVIVYDTLDELFDMAEKEVIRLHNRKNPDKKTQTINSAFGGFGKGQDKVIDIILERVWELKKVGISMIVVGHTKARTKTDPTTGQEYDMLTTNLSHKYFDSIKNKLHFLGVASIQRDVSKVKDGKDIMGKDKYKNITNSESRIITFRDDNYSIDSKSRFAEIVDSITLDVDELIKAITDAIKLEHEKQSGAKSIDETKKEQEKQKEKEIEANVEEVSNKKENEHIEKLLEALKAKVDKLKSKKSQLVPFINKLKELGYTSIGDVNSVEHIEMLNKELP